MMMFVTVVPCSSAFTLADSHRSVATLIDLNGVIVARTQSLNPNTNQENLHWVKFQPTTGWQQSAKLGLRQLRLQLHAHACHAW